jgi:hypothetical protein
MTYNLSSEKPVSKFAFQIQPAALQRGAARATRAHEHGRGGLLTPAARWGSAG